MGMHEDEIEQARVWDILYARLESILRKFGKEGVLNRGDYWVVDDNWGCRQHKIYIFNLKLLAPPIIKLLQMSLVQHPDWEYVVEASSDHYGNSWPSMGLIVRRHEIVDQLQRQYLPREFQNIEFQGSRRGTIQDSAGST